RTYGRSFEHDRPAAARAAHRRNGGAQLGDLRVGDRTNEVLLAEELDVRREAAVAVAAAVIREARRLPDVARQRQRRRAAGTGQERRVRGARVALRRTDRAKQLDQRAGRELLALRGVEPERLAVVACIDGNRGKRRARQRERPHRLAAARAGQLGHVTAFTGTRTETSAGVERIAIAR